MTVTTHVDTQEMRQDPSFRLGYEFPEVLDAILELATPPSAAQRVERIASTFPGRGDAVHHTPQMLSFSMPRDESLLGAVIGLAHELDLKVALRLYDRVEDMIYDLWTPAQVPEQASLDLTDIYSEQQVQGRDLYLDVTPESVFSYRIVHILLG